MVDTGGECGRTTDLAKHHTTDVSSLMHTVGLGSAEEDIIITLYFLSISGFDFLCNNNYRLYLFPRSSLLRTQVYNFGNFCDCLSFYKIYMKFEHD